MRTRLSRGASVADGERSLAIFVDFENLALGFTNRRERFDISRVLERMVEKGKIVVKKAYADWGRFQTYTHSLHEAAIELIEIPRRGQSGKNSADIRLCVDAMDLAYSKDHIDTFVVISGDSDFSPLVSKLKELGKHVIGLGMQDSTSELLRDNCDEFIYYEDLDQQIVEEPSALATLPDSKRKAFALLLESLQALQRENKEVMWSSMIKDTMKRKKPSFNETYHGYRTFSELLEDARLHGLLELETDPRSKTYVVTRFGEGMQRTEEPLAESSAPGSQVTPAPSVPSVPSVLGSSLQPSVQVPLPTTSSPSSPGANASALPLSPLGAVVPGQLPAGTKKKPRRRRRRGSGNGNGVHAQGTPGAPGAVPSPHPGNGTLDRREGMSGAVSEPGERTPPLERVIPMRVEIPSPASQAPAAPTAPAARATRATQSLANQESSPRSASATAVSSEDEPLAFDAGLDPEPRETASTPVAVEQEAATETRAPRARRSSATKGASEAKPKAKTTKTSTSSSTSTKTTRAKTQKKDSSTTEAAPTPARAATKSSTATRTRRRTTSSSANAKDATTE